MANAVVFKTTVWQDVRVRLPPSAPMIQELNDFLKPFLGAVEGPRQDEPHRHTLGVSRRADSCYVLGMTLREFLKERSRDTGQAAEDRQKIREYSEAVRSLIQRIRQVLSPYELLEIEEWEPLLKERWIPYNAPALTVRFRADEIIIEPKGAFVVEGKGRIAMTQGIRKVHLDWLEDDKWAFRWVLPRETEPMPLTDTAIENLVMGLLA